MVKNLPANAGDLREVGSIPASGRSPGEREWLATSVFLPGEFHGQKSLAGTIPGFAKSWTGLSNSLSLFSLFVGFPGGASGKEPACQCRRLKRHGLNP